MYLLKVKYKVMTPYSKYTELKKYQPVSTGKESHRKQS